MQAGVKWMVLASLLALPALAGCGGDSGGGGSGGGNESALKPPAQPAPKDCRADVLKTNEKAQSSAPKPGRYTYGVKGTRRDLDQNGVPTALPTTAPLTITPATKVGKLVCFRSQIEYTPKQANTVTFVIRGGDFYIAAIDFYVAGQTLTLRPNPPIKAVDGSGALDWNGTFSGPTTGQFAGSALGRKPFTFEGHTEKALGVELRFSLAGELRGTNKQTIWLSLDSGTLYDQEVDQVQNFGSQPIELKYRAKLKSLPG